MIDPDNPYMEAGRLLFAGPCDFMLSVVSMETLPAPDLAEVAFAGRSNVGKSSLINALTGHNNLARASNTPGRTRELNFFDLGGKIRIVDLPGYGYAKAPKTEIARWTKLTREYLRGRPNLRRVFMLIDSRHGIKPNDLDIMSMFDEAAVVYQIILTKADKPKKGQLAEVVEKTQKQIAKRPAAHPEVLLTSSAKKTGLSDVKAHIASLAEL